MSFSIWGKTEKPLTRPAFSRPSRDRGTAKVTRPNGQTEMYGSPHRKDSSTDFLWWARQREAILRDR